MLFLALARLIRRISEWKPGRHCWKISFLNDEVKFFVTWKWKVAPWQFKGAEAELDRRRRRKTTEINHPEEALLSWCCLSTTHTITSLLFTCTASKQTILNCRYIKLSGAIVDALASVHPLNLPTSFPTETWNWFDSTCSPVCLCSPLIHNWG